MTDSGGLHEASTKRGSKKSRLQILLIILTSASFVLMVIVNYAVGISADETYYGSRSWHVLGWVTVGVFISMCAVTLLTYLMRRKCTP